MVTFKNILLTTDFSNNSTAARPYAVELAKKYGATLHLLHVFEDAGYYHDAGMNESVPFAPLDWIENAQAERAKSLKAWAAAIETQDGVKALTTIRVGSAPTEIINYAAENRIDCMVISTHGKTGLAHFIFGSIAEKLVRMSPCPVLTIRPRA